MPVEYRGFEGVTKFFYLACTKIQGVQVYGCRILFIIWFQLVSRTVK